MDSVVRAARLIRVRRYYTKPPYKYRITCRVCSVWHDYAEGHSVAMLIADAHYEAHCREDGLVKG